VAGLACALTAVGCSDSRDSKRVADYQRLELSSSIDSPATDAIVHTWVPTPGAPPKLYGGVEGAVETLVLSKAAGGLKEPHAALVVRKAGKNWMVQIPISDDIPSFNEVTVECAVVGRTYALSVSEYLEAGVVLSLSPSHTLRPTGQIEHCTSAFREARSGLGKQREIRVHFSGAADLMALTAVHLSLRPWESFLPASDGSGLHRVGTVWRRSVGLVPGAQVDLGEVRVPAGSELSLHVALATRLHTPLDQAEVELLVESRGGKRIVSRTFVAQRAQAAAWERIAFRFDEDITGLGRLRLTSQDKEAYVLIADPLVARQVDSAPTVVFITSDTHRADHMGYVGAPSPVHTPNLDALSLRGVRFLDCFAPNSSTNPSHVAMMTGTSPRDTRIVTNTVELAKRARTLAESFAEAGYRTIAVVSAPHLTPAPSGLGQGFDRFEGSDTVVPDAEQSVAIALAQLEEAKGVPVFLWLHLFDAHSPYGPPEPFDRKYYPKDRDPRSGEFSLGVVDNCLPPWLDGVRDAGYFYSQYRAEVDYLDHSLGRLFDLPRVRAGIVAFTADHGESFGQHGIYWNHAGLYPDTIRVPLILTWPGAPGLTEVTEPVESVDIGRTLLDLAGASVPFPGRDLRWSLAESPERQARFTLNAHYLEASMSVQGWLLILHLKPHQVLGETIARERGEVELYNLDEDPLCARNLVLDELPRATKMRERLIEWLDQADPQGLGVGTSDLSGEERALLNQLGYADTSDSYTGEKIWDPMRDAKGFGGSPWSRLFHDKNINPEKMRPYLESRTFKGH